MTRQIAVIGPSEPDRERYEKAREVGRLLGEADVILICGGRTGVMEAACRGIQERSGGRAVGILPGSSLSGGNRYLDLIIPAGTGNARNLAVVQSGRAVIAVGKSSGTLIELALARKVNRPVYGVDSRELPGLPYEVDLTPQEAVSEALKHLDE